jgi:hypothetical protein
MKRDEAEEIIARIKAERKAKGLHDEAKGNGKHGEHDELSFLDISAWDDQAAPPRAWAVLDRIPLRQPTLLSGEGAIGKTIIALQLSVAHVIGRDWARARTGDLFRLRG